MQVLVEENDGSLVPSEVSENKDFLSAAPPRSTCPSGSTVCFTSGIKSYWLFRKSPPDIVLAGPDPEAEGNVLNFN